jgi:hypothetical protein
MGMQHHILELEGEYEEECLPEQHGGERIQQLAGNIISSPVFQQDIVVLQWSTLMEKTKQYLFGNRSTNKFRSLMSIILFL